MASRLRFYMCEIAPAISGCERLTLEQTGLYRKLLDFIYATEDRLYLIRNGASCEATLAAKTNCSLRVFKRVMSELVQAERIWLEPVDNSILIRDDKASKCVASAVAAYENRANHCRSNAETLTSARANSKTYASNTPSMFEDRIDKKKRKSLSGGYRNGLSTELSTAPSASTSSNGNHPTNPVRIFEIQIRPLLPGDMAQQWLTISAAQHPNHPNHATALELCLEAAASIGKALPFDWPRILDTPEKQEHKGPGDSPDRR